MKDREKSFQTSKSKVIYIQETCSGFSPNFIGTKKSEVRES